MSSGRPFTPEEDAVIVEMAPDHSIATIARVISRTRSVVSDRMKRMREEGVLVNEQRQCRNWTPEEEEEMIYLLRRFPSAVVAERLGRSHEACKKRLRRIGLEETEAYFRETPEGRSGILGREVLAIFGVDKDVLYEWRKRGVLVPVSRSGMRKSKSSETLYTDQAIREFIQSNSDRYFVEDMAFGPYRRLAEQVCREEEIDPWLSRKQAARVIGLKVPSVGNAIQSGRLKARRRPGTRFQWQIRTSDALAYKADPHRLRYQRKAA